MIPNKKATAEEKRVKNQMDWTQKLMYSHWFWIYLFAVSYTHLTLPTNREV